MKIFNKSRWLILLGLALTLSMNECSGQMDSLKRSNETYYDVGITGGWLISVVDLEISLAISKRISESTIIELKPVVGMLSEIYIYGDYGVDRLINYGGLIFGVCKSRGNKYLELNLGIAHTFADSYGNFEPNVLPVFSIGRKKVTEKWTTRLGVGYPYGVYGSIYYSLGTSAFR